MKLKIYISAIATSAMVVLFATSGDAQPLSANDEACFKDPQLCGKIFGSISKSFSNTGIKGLPDKVAVFSCGPHLNNNKLPFKKIVVLNNSNLQHFGTHFQNKRWGKIRWYFAAEANPPFILGKALGVQWYIRLEQDPSAMGFKAFNGAIYTKNGKPARMCNLSLKMKNKQELLARARTLGRGIYPRPKEIVMKDQDGKIIIISPKNSISLSLTVSNYPGLKMIGGFAYDGWRPLNPGHRGIQTAVDPRKVSQLSSFLLGDDSSVTRFKLWEDWNQIYGMEWDFTAKLRREPIVKVNDYVLNATVVNVTGESVKLTGRHSSWAIPGIELKSEFTLDRRSLIPLSIKTTFSEASRYNPRPNRSLVLVEARYANGEVITLQQFDTATKKIIAAEEKRLAALAEKRAEEERLRREAEARERKRATAEAARRKAEEEKRLAALAEKRAEEERRRKEALGRKRAEEERLRLAALEKKRADKALFDQLSNPSELLLGDVQAYVSSNPDTSQLIAIISVATSIKAALEQKSGSRLKSTISTLRQILAKEAKFASFEERRVIERQEKRVAAERRAKEERLAAISEAQTKIKNYLTFMKAEVTQNFLSQPEVSKGLLPVVSSLDEGKGSDDLAVLRKLEGDADAVLKKYKLTSKYAEVQKTVASLRKTKEKKVAAVADAPKARPARQAKPSAYADLDFGQYHALIIGNNNYKNIPKLQTAQQDARVLASTLETSFGFKVKLLIDATRDDIIRAFDGYSRKLRKSDNLLIYYAGHGWLDKEQGEGFWLPVDAEKDSRLEWISNATITSNLRGMQAKHVMVVADSCYSGTLTRGLRVELTPGDYIRRVTPKRARMVISSGGLEPVEDKGKAGHSPFASALLSTLKDTTDVITGTDLFKKIQRPVQLSADQMPVFADIRKAGHEGGDFIFVRRR